MKTKHLVTYFVVPVFFYLAVALYFMSGISLMATLGTSPGFVIIGMVMFVLGYNCWAFAKTMKGL